MTFARTLAAVSLSLAATTLLAQTPAPASKPRHNVILFVADGLRRNSVTPEDMPTLYRIRTEGVDLRNSHSVFPTVTTANASAIATGHGLGDTGDFGNVIYPGALLAQPGVPTAKGSIAPFLESDDVLATLNGFYNGNYIAETTLLAAAHASGFSVASVGKLGPTSIQQIASVNRNQLGEMVVPDTIIVDDSTGYPGGIPLKLDFHTQLTHSKLPDQAPQRTNGYAPTLLVARPRRHPAQSGRQLPEPNPRHQRRYQPRRTAQRRPRPGADHRVARQAPRPQSHHRHPRHLRPRLRHHQPPRS